MNETKAQFIVSDFENHSDPVNHPSHYKTGKYECIDVMEEALGRDAVKGFCLCNSFKYLYRAKKKNGLEDLKKARWYLDKLIEMRTEDEEDDDETDQPERTIRLSI